MPGRTADALGDADRSARPGAPDPALRALAAAHGLQLRHRDGLGRWHAPDAEAIAAVLGALGVPVGGAGGAAEALRLQAREAWDRLLEPVLVAWDGRLPPLRLRMPERLAGVRVRACLTGEAGELARTWEAGDAPVTGGARVDGRAVVERSARWTGRLPLGYHRLEVAAGFRRGESMVISAPARCPAPPQRDWGLFVPLYALRTERDWGVGDLDGLARLLAWMESLGGRAVATLPLLASFLAERGPFEPSPYAPVTRRFWNEVFVDVEAVPEVGASAEARAMLGSGAFRSDLDRLRSAELVDHRAVAARKRRILELGARELRDRGGSRRERFERHVAERPLLASYARFRAACEGRDAPWRAWPAAEREGRLDGRALDGDAVGYHTYAQWVFAEQLESVAGAGDRRLGLDLPLGVHPDGFDTWHDREAFALGTHVGAPPDDFFTAGQDWGFPPLHPERARASGHAYLIESLRTALPYARVLRVDHVMGLHRMLWIPEGMEAGRGVYVRYPAEEAYAILSLEAARTGTLVVGEDLGTVQRLVRRRMRRHGVLGTHVLQVEASPECPFPPPTEAAEACLNTHDTGTFAAFWTGGDLEEAVRCGVLDPDRAAAFAGRRRAVRRAMSAAAGRDRAVEPGAGEPGAEEPGAAEVLSACLEREGASRSPLVLVTLEDLWLEDRPQNVPGTGAERPNWRRRIRRPLDRFAEDPAVLNTLDRVERARRGGP